MERIQPPSFKLELVNAIRMNVNNNKMNELSASDYNVGLHATRKQETLNNCHNNVF